MFNIQIVLINLPFRGWNPKKERRRMATVSQCKWSFCHLFLFIVQQFAILFHPFVLSVLGFHLWLYLNSIYQFVHWTLTPLFVAVTMWWKKIQKTKNMFWVSVTRHSVSGFDLHPSISSLSSRPEIILENICQEIYNWSQGLQTALQTSFALLLQLTIRRQLCLCFYSKVSC